MIPYTKNMERLLDVLIAERSEIGLFEDVVKAQWAEIAVNEGMNQIVIWEYVSHIVLKEN